MRKKIEFIMAIMIIATALIMGKTFTKYVSGEVANEEKVTIIIDPGHGASDPGKVGVNKVLEKDINLVIGKKVKKLLDKEKISLQMTRNDDTSKAKGKIEDMKARVKSINETKPALAVSIHQNSYHESSINGAQVFYYKHSDEGEKAAVIMQNALLAFDAENTRQAKANDTYYLLKKTEVPTIIVECGFLTNPEEAKMLTEEKYQNQVAEAICSGIKEYLKISEN